MFLSEPLSNIWKRCLLDGEYPDIWKVETVTPIPKKNSNPKSKDLRKISVTKNFSKLFEKYICIQHLLVRLVDRILTALDKNNQHEVYGIVLKLVDWSQAFDRQCTTLAIDSFIKKKHHLMMLYPMPIVFSSHA